jgi:transcription termination factor Rho
MAPISKRSTRGSADSSSSATATRRSRASSAGAGESPDAAEGSSAANFAAETAASGEAGNAEAPDNGAKTPARKTPVRRRAASAKKTAEEAAPEAEAPSSEAASSEAASSEAPPSESADEASAPARRAPARRRPTAKADEAPETAAEDDSSGQEQLAFFPPVEPQPAAPSPQEVVEQPAPSRAPTKRKILARVRREDIDRLVPPAKPASAAPASQDDDAQPALPEWKRRDEEEDADIGEQRSFDPDDEPRVLYDDDDKKKRPEPSPAARESARESAMELFRDGDGAKKRPGDSGDSGSGPLGSPIARDRAAERRRRWEERRERRRERKMALAQAASGGSASASAPGDTGPRLNLNELRERPIEELMEIASNHNIEDYSSLPRQELIFKILQARAERSGNAYSIGTVDITQGGYGFLRNAEQHYHPGPDDVFIAPGQIRKYGLRKGDTVAGVIRRPGKKEQYWTIMRVDSINDESIEDHRKRPLFENLTPLYPDQKLHLEHEPKEMTTRLLDLMVPIGKGQRGLIVAPPRTGKTMILQKIARSIEVNHPEIELIVLLIDERPEEVTDMQRTVDGEVVASTFDEPAERHVQVAEIVIEKAKRLVERGRDVLILLDSITRLARAYNLTVRSSGKLLTGGLDANSLQKPKRFFGAGRNIEEGGSLTILATALVDTGSKMDDIIFEEFKGTGNMEAHLDRDLIDRRVFPAIDIHKSGTRREELLLNDTTLQRVWLLRKVLNELSAVETMEFLLERLKKTENNEEFLNSMNT